ncbi:MAG: hypothetical protein HWD85_13100 [Flavobacteriaceae bacterium]|nr:hypothetical protein [Flavobacteriaceae bacterium]
MLIKVVIEVLISIRYSHLFYYLSSFRRKYKYAFLRKKTKYIIEGFPRSGNTFAFNYFKFIRYPSGYNLGEIGHHSHLPYQIILGIKRNLPILLLIREPVDSISSLLLKRNISIKQLPFYGQYFLRMYVRYYSSLLSFKSNIFVVPFTDLISKPEFVLYEFSKFYSLDIEVDKKRDLSDNVLQHIFNVNRSKVASVLHLAVPSDEKIKRKLFISEILNNLAEISEAKEIYNEFL